MSPAHVPVSPSPPDGIATADAPLFVSLGFDDNDDAAGMNWALDLLGARGLPASFFLIAARGRDATLARTWRRAHDEGHELGNHSHDHTPARDGRHRTSAAWRADLATSTQALQALLPGAAIQGFRAPYLEYNDATLAAVAAQGLRYDCSIEEGFEPGQDGSNACWPYTLDHGSPGHTAQQTSAGRDEPMAPLTAHPGLWELPVSAVYVPPDDRCAAYDIAPGLRERLRQRQPWFDARSGAITGFDYNLWAARDSGGFELTAAETIAVLHHTFEQRRRGNRAPFLFGLHPHCYLDAWTVHAPAITAADRRAVLQDFLDCVRAAPEARVATHADVLSWMQAPRSLSRSG